MKISFIVPVYNCKKHLPACVDSILAAGVSDFEIILVDDGSTDDSGALCDDLSQKHPQIRTIHQPNGGVSAARNRGIQDAEGEYILFVDADDFLIPFSADFVRHLNLNKPDVLIFGMCFQYRKESKLIREETLSYGTDQTMDLAQLGMHSTELYDLNYFSPVWNKIIKRSVILEHNISFDTRLINYEDLAFSLSLLSKCETIAVSSEVHYLYQIPDGADHTVQRIARIDDIIGNTDLIAQAFLELEGAISKEEATNQIRRVLFRIYMELFWVKMQTTAQKNIKRYCADFRANTNIQNCIPYIKGTPAETMPVYLWIQRNQTWHIWFYVRYRNIRHKIAVNVKSILRRR